ncbi:RecE family exodeoxyribonuclease [Salmonella enterica subsp. diarizonae]|nr:RecE family exodeoxyribonuclease [Salmonella enterica]
MKNITQLVFRPKKSAAAKGVARPGTIWFDNDDPDEIDALSTLAIKEAGFKRSDFFKPARVDHLVVDDMPEEGVFDTAFCERYKLAEDGKSWLLPAAKPETVDASAGENTDSVSEQQKDENATDNTDSGDAASAAVTNSETAVDTATYASDKADADSVNDVNVNGEPMNEVEKGMEWPMKDLSLPVRWMAQKGMDSKVLFLKTAERERLTKVMEADDENNSQHLTNIKAVTTGEMAPEIDKLTTYHLHRLVTAFDKVSEKVERMGPSMAKRFVQAWLDTEYIDQGILVNEWCAGRHVSRIEKPTATSVSEVPVKQKTPVTEAVETEYPRRSEKTTHRTINIEIASALIPEADPCNLRPVLNQAKDIIHSDREDWKRWSATLSIIPEIKTYSRQTIFDVVRKAPAAVHNGSPELRRTWCESFLAVYGVRDPDWYEYAPENTPTTHEENAARIRQAGKCLRDIQSGKFNDDEAKTQPEDSLADKPPVPEAVEQDTTEHHPDPQPLENESPVSQTEAGYQKIRAELHEARKNIPPKNPVDVGKQLAAARGEYVEGISDPNDPKWVHNNYSASNQGEKTENEDADDVNQNDDTVIQNTDSVNHSEPSAVQIEPEAPETEPKSLQSEPVTKVADGVFDVSAFFADTSNQGEKTEVTPPNNDVRSHEGAEEKATDAPATTESLLHEIVRLQSINNQLLEDCAAYRERAETRHERFLEALFCGITRLTSCWLVGEKEVKFEEGAGD